MQGDPVEFSNARAYAASRKVTERKRDPALLLSRGFNDYAKLYAKYDLQPAPAKQKRKITIRIPLRQGALSLKFPASTATLWARISRFKAREEIRRKLEIEEQEEEDNEAEEHQDQHDAASKDILAILEGYEGQLEDASEEVGDETQSQSGEVLVTQIVYEREAVQAATLKGVKNQTSTLTQLQIDKITARLAEIQQTQPRSPSNEQLSRHFEAQEQVTTQLIQIAEESNNPLFAVVYPNDSSASSVIAASNWPTTSAFQSGNELSDEQMSQVQLETLRHCQQSVSLYCTTPSETTNIMRGRGLIPKDGVEFVDLVSVVAPAHTTGVNPASGAGEGWRKAQNQYLLSFLKNSLSAGPATILFSSQDLMTSLQEISVDTDSGLYIKKLKLSFDLATPTDESGEVEVFLFTLSSDSTSLANFSIIVADYSPIYLRITKSRAARITSCLTLAFFRAWTPTWAFSPLTESEAHYALHLTPWLSRKHLVPQVFKEAKAVGAEEIRAKRDLSHTSSTVQTLLAAADLSLLTPAEVADLALDTPLQRLLLSWGKKASSTHYNRWSLEQMAENLAEYIEDNPKAKKLGDLPTDVLQAVQPYTTSQTYAIWRKAASNRNLSDLQLLLKIAERPQHRAEVRQLYMKFGDTWKLDESKQTAESLSALTLFLGHNITIGLNVPVQTSEQLVLARRLLKEKEYQKASFQERMKDPEERERRNLLQRQYRKKYMARPGNADRKNLKQRERRAEVKARTAEERKTTRKERAYAPPVQGALQDQDDGDEESDEDFVPNANTIEDEPLEYAEYTSDDPEPEEEPVAGPSTSAAAKKPPTAAAISMRTYNAREDVKGAKREWHEETYGRKIKKRIGPKKQTAAQQKYQKEYRERNKAERNANSKAWRERQKERVAGSSSATGQAGSAEDNEAGWEDEVDDGNDA